MYRHMQTKFCRPLERNNMSRIFVFHLVMIALLALGCQNATTAGVNNTAANTNNPTANKATAPAASNSAPAAATQGDDAPRITLAEAKAAFDAGEAFFIDTRGAEQFKAE